jgi:type IV pilus assembly protein PilY1
VQKYSDQLRLAALATCSIRPTAPHTAGRYGGVLRAPMKYVGAKTFDINGVENTPSRRQSCCRMERNDRRLRRQPRRQHADRHQRRLRRERGHQLPQQIRPHRHGGHATRSTTRSASFTTRSLRYLQGLQPSTIATQNLTTDMYDGYPVFTAWTDPYGDGRSSSSNYACLKSNIVVIGDINTHDGNRFPAADARQRTFRMWASGPRSARAFETGTDTDLPRWAGNSCSTRTGNPATNGNPRSESIIGHSYWAHTHDIRGYGMDRRSPPCSDPGLRVKSFFFDVNEYGDQNNNNTRRNNNQFFTSAKYGGFESDPANTGSKPFNTFGNPFKRQDGTVDNNVWQDPARPAEASTYYLQSSARSVLSAFDSIFSRASTSARSIAGSAVQSKSLQTSNAVYQGAFDTSDWSGDLLALPITISGGTASISATATWSATARMALLSGTCHFAHHRRREPGQCCAQGHRLPVGFAVRPISRPT